jgi:hypothetical protein
MTIEQTFAIPENGWVHLDLPPNFPAGTSAKLVVTISGNADNLPARVSAREALEQGRGIAKRLGSTLTVDRFLELGWQDRILEDSFDAIHRKERMQFRDKKKGKA